MIEEKTIYFLRSQRLAKFQVYNKSILSIYTKKFNHEFTCWEEFDSEEKEIYENIVKLKDEYNEKIFANEDFKDLKKTLIELLRKYTFIEFADRIIYADEFNNEKRRYIEQKYKPFTKVPHPTKRYFQ